MNKGGAQHKGHSGSASASNLENIVLVGRTGNGKSATANSLIGKRVFESKAHASGVTMQCQTHETVTKDGHNIKVIDTPGVLDLSVSAKFISKEIVRCLNLADGGIHAVLLVLSARTPITDEEEETLSTLQALFGTQILDYVIVVITGGDVLEDNGENLEDCLARDCPAFIKEFNKELLVIRNMAAPESITNIVLVGRTGHGKSATGNTLLGQTMFKTNAYARDDAMCCKMFRAAIDDGPIINVIETPGIGFLDLSVSEEYLSKEIIKCLTMAEEGIHAVLFVLSVRQRLAQKEVESTFDTLQRIFGSKVLDYFIVVFTGGDELEEDNLTLDDYLRDGCPEFMKRIIGLCRGRKVLFNNKTKDKDRKAGQVKHLLALVADIGKQNGGMPYTDKLSRMIKESDDNLMRQEKDIKAKNLEDIARMKEKLQMEHDRTMNAIMMAHIVESDLKQSVASHKKEMHQLKETLQLQNTETMNTVAHMVENALKNHKPANETEIYTLEFRLMNLNTKTMYMMENMVENALKMSQATHEKEMDQLKNTLHLNDSQTMNMTAQMSAAAHEREMHQQAQARRFRQPGQPSMECNIM